MQTQLLVLALTAASVAHAHCRAASSNVTFGTVTRLRMLLIPLTPCAMPLGVLQCLGTYADIYRPLMALLASMVQRMRRFLYSTEGCGYVSCRTTALS